MRSFAFIGQLSHYIVILWTHLLILQQNFTELPTTIRINCDIFPDFFNFFIVTIPNVLILKDTTIPLPLWEYRQVALIE